MMAKDLTAIYAATVSLRVSGENSKRIELKSICNIIDIM